MKQDTRYRFEPPVTPVPVILDTDMATDCDDVGAMAVMHALASAGEASVLAVVTNNSDSASAGAVAAVNAFYGRQDISLGAYQGNEVGIRSAEFVHELSRDAEGMGLAPGDRTSVTPAVEVYRRKLSEADDGSVVIISIGHLNNLAELLESGPDAYSRLSGTELIKRKTPHLIVMGGDYPSGQEHNFAVRGGAPFAVKVVDRWPVPILFSGWTLGKKVVTGPGLARMPPTHPVRKAYASHESRPLINGRPSWDQTAVMAAIQGAERWWKLSSPGRNYVEPDGSNCRHDDPCGPHAYLQEKVDPDLVAEETERLMRHGTETSVEA